MRNFTTEDFNGAGQYLVRNDYPENKFTDSGFLSTVMYKVGYCRGKGISEPDNDENVYTLISMSDGLTKLGYFDTRNDPNYGKQPYSPNTSTWIWVQFNGKQSLCDYLNDQTLCTGEYRFATQEEVVRVVMYQKSRWR